MTFGILEPRTQQTHVPGTVLLDSEENQRIDESAALKKGTGRAKHIVLNPQPSNDPNDPLNWPLRQRDALLCLYCYCTLLASGGVGPILSSLTVLLAIEFKTDFTAIALLTGYSLCATGAAGIFVSAAARKYGKRPVTLLSVALAFAGTLWGGAAQSYNSLLGARIVQGLAVAAFESVMYSVIGDLYYVHERGARMAVLSTSISGIANLPAMLSGKVATDLGWRWVFWLLAIFLGIGLVLVILVGWETSYVRSPIYETDISSQDNLEIIDKLKGKDGAVRGERSANIECTTTADTVASTLRSRESFVARIKPFHGSFAQKSLWKLIIKPFTIMINPAVIWAVLLLSFPTLWLVGINVVIAQIFASPPYLLDAADLGYLSAGPLVGGTLGCLLCGFIADPIIKWISRRNHGVYEPEFRLLLIFGLAFFSTLGYFMFGNLIGQGKSPAGMAAIWSVIVVTIQFASMAVGTYMVDAFRNISVEVFIMTMIVKNFLFFGFTFFLNDWVVDWGPPKMFNVIGGIQLALCLLTVPLWVYGKRLRVWWHQYDLLRV